MTTLNPADRYLILINTFEVTPENADRLVEVLREASGPISGMTGFVSANLHVSADRTRVVNYAQWRSRADYDAFVHDPDAQPHMRQAADLVKSYDPVFYDLLHVVGAPRG
ncbi:MAG: antibiotic biosynthesis monooxygenase [Sphingomonas sp.]|nr:MAG: antibiotic biosynthesis monooxygenase [Sphingomonas sp.]